MVSLRSLVFSEYRRDNEITHDSLAILWDKENPETIKRYLTEARSLNLQEDKKISKISLDAIEPMVVDAVNKAPNTSNIKLALDFIRLKQSTEGLQDDIDIEHYLKKVEAITGCQGEVDND